MSKRFEELIAWQKARDLTGAIYDLSGGREFSRDFGLKDQIRRAAVSVMSNIAEGFERDSDAEYGRFLAIAKGSCGEVRCQLYVALDQGYIDAESFRRACERAEEVSRIVQGLNRKVRAKAKD